jgi:DNA recombination protein RmuC
MLERMLPRGMWERQYLIDGREKVDVAIKYRDVIIPVDAKFPRDDYLRYLEAQSPEEKARHWRAYETAVKVQIKSIGGKYIKPEKGTAEFALMFIPSEAIYYETITEKNYLGETSTIFSYAQENHVVPVSPNTFYMFLQVIVLAIRNVEIIRGAKKLQEGLLLVQRSFEGFYKKYEDMGKSIDKAGEAFRVGDSHVQRFKQRVDDTINLDGLAVDKDATLPPIDPTARGE